MGLDQYAYVASKPKTAFDDPNRINLTYWRKHPNLQGWMNKLYESKGCPNAVSEDDALYFNQVELELTWEDIHQLEKDIKSGEMSKLDTKGFFFGPPGDISYRDQDLQFCIDAKFHIFLKHRVFYYSSW